MRTERSGRGGKRGLLACAAVAAMAVFATPALAQGESAGAITFSIEGQSLDAALIEFARVANVQVLYAPEIVRGKTANQVSGAFSPSEALRQLLAGSGLVANTRDGLTFSITQQVTESDAETPIDEAEVVVTGVRNSMTTERYRAAVPVDVLTAEDMGRYAGSDVADVMVRIPGVSASARGNFAVIRGLSERYNSVTFDGMVLPSSDPDRQSVELDQFPSRLLDGMIVYKAFSPEQPGNLSGGGVELRPLRFPEERILSFSIGASASEDVFTGDDDFLTYQTGGRNDLWGRGSEDRFSTDDALRDPLTPRNNVPARSADRPFTATPDDMPFGPRASFVYGDSFRLDNGVQIGVGAALTYDSSYSTETGATREGSVFNTNLNADGDLTYQYYTSAATGEEVLVPRDGNSYIRSEQNIALGALANLAIRFNENHEISLTGFSSQTATDKAQYDYDIIAFYRNAFPTPEAIDAGSAPTDTADRFRYTLNYRERNLSTLALVGDHVFPSTGGGQLSWALAYSTAYQDEPDNRRLMYLRPYGEAQFIVPDGTDVDGAIVQTWRRIEEDQRNLRLSWRQPLGQTDAFFEFGGALSATERDYGERTGGGVVPFEGAGYRRFDSPHDIWEVLDSGLAGSGSGSVTLARDVDAIYFLGGTSVFTSSLKLSGGVRFERTVIQTSGFGGVPGNPALSSSFHYARNLIFFPDLPRVSAPTPELEAAANANINQIDFLPALNLTWDATSNLIFRLGASETVARPSLREIGNYYTWDPDLERYDHGNALLQLSNVRNLDARAEYHFDSGFVSLSLFQKTIDNPIERFAVEYPLGSDRVGTWFNNPNAAELRGAEFEFRSDLGFAGNWMGPRWRDALSNLTLGGNATWIDAEVRGFTASAGTGIYTTDNTRRLYDQPEWIVNFDATYEYEPWGSSLTLSWIASSDVLTLANHVDYDGRQTGFDEYLNETSRLDLVFSQRLTDRYSVKLSARNLLDPEQLYIRDRDQTGGAEIVDRRWREGRSFSVTLSAEF